MSSNLIFHAISKRKWKEFNKGGYFEPEGNRYENGIVCLQADNLKNYINSHFQGRRQILLLVIDASRLVSNTEEDKESGYIVVKEKINLDAVLDKILIKPNREGLFDIEVTED